MTGLIAYCTICWILALVVVWFGLDESVPYTMDDHDLGMFLIFAPAIIPLFVVMAAVGLVLMSPGLLIEAIRLVRTRFTKETPR